METITPLLEKKKQEEFDQKVTEDVLLEAFLEQLKERHKNVCLSLFIFFNVLMLFIIEHCRFGSKGALH